MDFVDEDWTENDLLLLDAAAAQEVASNSNSLQEPHTHASSDSQLQQLIGNCFDDDDEAQLEHLECLKSKFKHSSFRAKQWDIIKAIKEKRDVCAVMATGYGKSLCYQFPAVYSNRMSLVISPLIALMQAQVIDLQAAGISACLVGTAQKDPYILNRIAEGKFVVVYSSPEYLQTTNGDKLLQSVKGKLALVAIDEAHVSVTF